LNTATTFAWAVDASTGKVWAFNPTATGAGARNPRKVASARPPTAARTGPSGPRSWAIAEEISSGSASHCAARDCAGARSATAAAGPRHSAAAPAEVEEVVQITLSGPAAWAHSARAAGPTCDVSDVSRARGTATGTANVSDARIRLGAGPSARSRSRRR
jgi:hypothetical protein